MVDTGLTFEEQQKQARYFIKKLGISLKELNKKELDDLDIHMSNESLVSLTFNFSVIRDNDHVLTRLAEAKSEDADLEKATKNIIANKGQRRPIGRKTSSSTKKEDVNAVAESFIRSFQRAMEDTNKINSIIIF